ncbi:hypothetical protein ACLM5H_14170 [Fredinandcohnia humi]
MKGSNIIFLPLIFSIIFSLHLVIDVPVYMRRVLALITLGTVLWFIYYHLKEPVLVGRNIIVVILLTVFTVLLVLITLFKTGW